MALALYIESDISCLTVSPILACVWWRRRSVKQQLGQQIYVSGE